MKKLIPIVLVLLCSQQSSAQLTGVYDGIPNDSVTFTFNPYDSLTRSAAYIDTIGSGIWRTGTTSKPFFAIGGSTYAIMTDTSKAYDTSINNSFTVGLKPFNFNTILSFKHKYQTRNGKDGGIVEYSIDNGTTWNNVLGDCNTTGTFRQGVFTQNFYQKTDTLPNGEAAFTGTSTGWIYSRVQLFIGLPIKATGGGPQCVTSNEIKFRFRFVSDNQPDTLDGWIIDDFKVEHDHYNGGIEKTANQLQAKVYPNPTKEILYIDMPEPYFTKASIINTTGQTVQTEPITNTHQTMNIGQLPTGIYQLLLQGDYGTKALLINKD